MPSQPRPDAAETGDDGPAVGAQGWSRGESLLAKFEESWYVADDLSARARVGSVAFERCEKREETRLFADESLETAELSPETYEDAQLAGVPFARRYEEVPSEYAAKTVDFVERDADTRTCPSCGGDTVVQCPDCGTGMVACGDCDGTGNRDCDCDGGELACQGCAGDGRVHPNEGSKTCGHCDGRGSFVCPSCEGEGRYRCPTCTGSGQQECPTCAGDGELDCEDCDAEGHQFVAKRGTLDLSVESETHVETQKGMPTAHVADAVGVKTDETNAEFDPPMPGGEGALRQRVEYYEVPTTEVEYTFDGETYRLYDVDGDLHAPDYPMSKARELAPYAAAVTAFVFALFVYLV